MARRRWEVPVEQLAWRCDPEALGFETTDELEPLNGIAGQERAIQSIEFGIDIGVDGYNLFLIGNPGAGRWHTARAQIQERARTEPRPPDWCYVHNFEDEDRPVSLSLPAGEGEQFASDVDEWLSTARDQILKAFQTEEYEEQKAEIVREHSERRDTVMDGLQERAGNAGFVIQMTPAGMMTVPIHEGEPLTPDQYEQLPDEEKHQIEERGRELPAQIEQAFRQSRAIDRETQERVRDLDQQTAHQAVCATTESLLGKHQGHEKIRRFLEAAQSDMVEHVDEFRTAEPSQVPDGPLAGNMAATMVQMQREEMMGRYKVNVLVNNAETQGAPVVCENHPTYYNLIGKMDFRVRFGVMTTDTASIKAGALHLANGGYLILDVADLLSNPLAWDGLKRSLRGGEVRIENLGEQMGLMPTASLQPEPIPIDLKVVLIGPPVLYYLLYALDQDFARLFKVKVDFDVEMGRDEMHLLQYAALIAAVSRQEGMKPFSKEAVARAAEFAAREREHQHKLATSYRSARELVAEASYWAGKNEREVVTAEDVRQALEAREYRSRMLEEKIQEWIAEGTLMVSTSGQAIAQVNGLSVTDLGGYAFGRPSRITARTFLGRGGVVNIEREVEMGGRIHNKGVLILSGYLGGKYARDVPLSLSATLTFEQLYEGVEGDSASAAELYAVLSSLADLPVRQDIAVTGSVNQHGEIQPVGGVTYKVEGFFHVCKLRGLTGAQGVIVPYQNVKNLMLKDEVIEAVREGKFHVWAIHTIDEGMEILTGVPAGRQLADGSYDEDSVNDRVLWRLRHFADTMRSFAVEPGTEIPEHRAKVAVAPDGRAEDE